MKALLPDVTAIDFAGDRAEPVPPPIVRQVAPDPQEEIFRRFRELREADPLTWARITSSYLVAVGIAERLDIDFADVRDALQRMNVNMLPLLDSPQGWVTIGEYVRSVTGNPEGAMFLPTIQ